MRLVAISGSLRAQSSNTALLQRAAAIASPPVHIELWQGLADVPAFNPDQDDAPPRGTRLLRQAVASADGVLISSPEYAHGIAGAMKNALDWLVGSGELYEKPLVLINGSARATIAQAALAETLRTMGATIVEDVQISMPSSGAADAVTDAALRRVVDRLAQAILSRR